MGAPKNRFTENEIVSVTSVNVYLNDGCILNLNTLTNQELGTVISAMKSVLGVQLDQRSMSKSERLLWVVENADPKVTMKNNFSSWEDEPADDDEFDDDDDDDDDNDEFDDDLADDLDDDDTNDGGGSSEDFDDDDDDEFDDDDDDDDDDDELDDEGELDDDLNNESGGESGGHDETHHPMIKEIIGCMEARNAVWLVGPAGTGKSYMARQAAEAFGLPVFAQSFCIQSSKADLLGAIVPGTGELIRTPFRDAWEHGGVFLQDEADAANPAIMVVLNDAIAAKVGTPIRFPDGDVPRHENFRVIATANTWGTGPDAEYMGRVKQDASTNDRFTMLWVDYDRDLERKLVVDILGDKADRWLSRCWERRDAAQVSGERIVVSTRGIVEGARLIAVGFTMDRAFEVRIEKGAK